MVSLTPLIWEQQHRQRQASSLQICQAHADIPAAQGLFQPANDKDSCGVGFVAELSAVPTRRCISDALTMLERMAHRGGCGCEENTGDGAGVLLALPHAFLAKALESEQGVTLPASPAAGGAGGYAVGQIFMPQDAALRAQVTAMMTRIAAQMGHRTLAWRDVPTDNTPLGLAAQKTEPVVQQWFIAGRGGGRAQRRAICRAAGASPPHTAVTALRLYVLRKVLEAELRDSGISDAECYICSLSGGTIVYKGQLTPGQLREYYPDLCSPDFTTYSALVHSRFSTNTFPAWHRAQPMRMLGHNGEINTLRGNSNWMRSREGAMTCAALEMGGDMRKQLMPVLPENTSDSGAFDAVLELLTRCGRAVPETLMMLVPEAWQNDPLMSEDKQAFYRYHSALMEPWDGPALLAFSDGRYLGATLDRNGLRPGRYYVTNDQRVIMASEVGVVDIDPSCVVRKGRLTPGQLLLLDFNEHRIIEDAEVKARYSSARPYSLWLEDNAVTLQQLTSSSTAPPLAKPHNGAGSSNGTHAAKRAAAAPAQLSHVMEDAGGLASLLPHLKMFGFTRESLEMLLLPMAKSGAEPLGSMGNDAALAAMSSRARQPFEYFKQLFAQVCSRQGGLQFANAASAIAALQALFVLDPGLAPVDFPAMARRGLRSVRVPARLQSIGGDPLLIVDVGHNPQAARALAEWLDAQPRRRVHAVYGALADKDVEGVINALGERVHCWHLAALDGHSLRGLTAPALAGVLEKTLPQALFTSHASVDEALAAARAGAAPGECILAFGSFYVASAILQASRHHPGVSTN
ncbi:MAG: hypothetical protein WDW36_009860 [Sanguina aurantia]